MPVWAEYLIYAAAVATALGVLWRKVLRPFFKLIAIAEEMMPLLRELTKEFKGTPHAFSVLDEIVAQFRTDSGSSLRDVVNRLEEASNANRASNEALTVSAESARQRAKDEREQVQRLILSLDRLSVKLDQLVIRVDQGAATSDRIEQQASAVAIDLAAAHKRADEHDSGEAGAAADASAQQTAKEKRQE